MSNFAPKIRPVLLFFVAAFLITGTAWAEGLVPEISPGNSQIPLYDPFIIKIKIEPSFKDPYDPDEVELNAHFTSPDGTETVMPGFYTGEGKDWEVRYTPVKERRYSYYTALKAGGLSLYTISV